MAKKKTEVVKKQPLLEKAIAGLISKVNLNTIIMTVVTGYFGVMGYDFTQKQDVVIEQSVKQDSLNTRSAMWRKRADSLHTIVNSKLDSIILTLKNK
jgi:hypothetical protein